MPLEQHTRQSTRTSFTQVAFRVPRGHWRFSRRLSIFEVSQVNQILYLTTVLATG